VRQQLNAIQTALHRTEENEEERLVRQQLNAIQTALHWTEENEEEHLVCQQLDANQTALHRAEGNEEQHRLQERLEVERQKRTKPCRYIGRGILCNMDTLNIDGLQYIHHGWMTTVCHYCNAIGFLTEKKEQIKQLTLELFVVLEENHIKEWNPFPLYQTTL
jgi:hypothetical protein